MANPPIDQAPVRTALQRLWGSMQLPDGDSTLVEWAVKNLRLAGRPYGFSEFPEHVQIMNDMHPRQVIEKPSQRGFTEMNIAKAISLVSKTHFDRFGRPVMKRCDVIYSLPTDPILKRISADRIDRSISDSFGAIPLSPTSVHVKELARGTIHCMHRGSATNVLSIAAEVVFIDEVDQGNMDIATNLDSRVQQASIFGTDDQPGCVFRYGNPVYFHGLASVMFKASDQFYFHIRCEHCGHWQVVTYPDSIANFYHAGQYPGSRAPYWMCLKCNKELTFRDLSWDRRDPNRITGGEWVAKFPDRTMNNDGLRGYQAPMAALKLGGGIVTARSFLLARDTGSYKDNFALFMSHKCGLPYADPEHSATPDVLRGYMMSESAVWGERAVHPVVVIGADQGAYIVGLTLVPGTKRTADDFGVWDIFMIEQVPNIAAFDSIDRHDEINATVRNGRFTAIIRELRPVFLCVDSVPDTSSAENLFLRYPDKVWRTTYGSVSDSGIIAKTEDELSQHIEHCRVRCESAQRTFHVDKTKTLDWLFSHIRAKHFRISKSFEASAKSQELFEHICSVEKIAEVTGDTGGKVRVFYRVGGADHLLMALMNASLAAMVAMNRAARYRGAVIKIDPSRTVARFSSGIHSRPGSR